MKKIFNFIFPTLMGSMIVGGMHKQNWDIDKSNDIQKVIGTFAGNFGNYIPIATI